MNSQLETIRQLKEEGMSMRGIMERLSLKKNQVENAFLQIKVLSMRPDSCPDVDSDDCPDNQSDGWTAVRTDTSEVHSYLPPSREGGLSKSPKDQPSEWNSNCTRYEVDFIITNYMEGYDQLEIKQLYQEECPDGFLSLLDIQQVIEMYDSRKKSTSVNEIKGTEIKLEPVKDDDATVLRRFNNLVGEDITAFLIWIDGLDDWDKSTVRACLSRVTALMSEIEKCLQYFGLPYREYEPYQIMASIKDTLATCERRRKSNFDFEDKAIIFVETFVERPLLDRFLYKLLEKKRTKAFF